MAPATTACLVLGFLTCVHSDLLTAAVVAQIHAESRAKYEAQTGDYDHHD